MPDYFIFGGCLRSELEFPELAEAHGMAPDWTLRVGRVDRDADGDILSSVQPTPSCGMRLSRHADGLRYTHSCSGTFQISADGTSIVFDAAQGGSMAIARTDVVARVLLHCVDQGTTTWLHGSAVASGDRAIAFLGLSGAGKSTTALALARAGARHLCDDTLPVELATPPVVWPSDHTLRLRRDTRELLAPSDRAVRRESDGKFIFTHAALAMTPVGGAPADGTRVPLRAIYLLQGPPPSDGPADAPVTRVRLGGTAAVPALMQHVRLGLVVPREMPVRLMQRLAALAQAVPVHALWITRDWRRLDAVAAQLLAWNAEPADAHDPIPAQQVATR